MGLDIVFSFKAATDAGLVITQDRNGTDEQITEAKGQHCPDPGYVDWLAEEISVINVPNTELHVQIHVCEDQISLRANKWGRVHAPLTEWLNSHNITWEEW